MHHLFGIRSAQVVEHPVDPRKLEWFATQMGTGVQKLTNHYADYKEYKSEQKKNKKKESIYLQMNKIQNIYLKIQ